MITAFLRKVFPLYRTFHRVRPKRFRLFSYSEPPLLEDLPQENVSTINQSSEKYFQRTENEEYWRNKPFSDQQQSGWYLMRLGHLMAGLTPGPGSRILDFGCGTGWTSIMLAQTGAEVVGVDISDSALKIAKENAQRIPLPASGAISFQNYDGTHLPFEDESFDLAIIFEAFHHLPNQKTILSELHRVLWKHGRLGFAEPGVGHADVEISNKEAEHGILEQDLDVEQFYRSALAAGFRNMELFVPAIHPRTFSLPITRALWFLRGFSFLLPANVNRVTMITSPIGVLHKGPNPITSLNARSYGAMIRPQINSLKVQSGSDYQIQLEIRNPTETAWLKEGWRGSGYVRVGAHLCDSTGQLLERDYGRVSLNQDVGENQCDVVRLCLSAPTRAGRYIVQIDAVNEGICWFAEYGSKIVEISLQVE